jgi:hypothetical protein
MTPILDPSTVTTELYDIFLSADGTKIVATLEERTSFVSQCGYERCIVEVAVAVQKHGGDGPFTGDRQRRGSIRSA